MSVEFYHGRVNHLDIKGYCEFCKLILNDRVRVEGDAAFLDCKKATDFIFFI